MIRRAQQIIGLYRQVRRLFIVRGRQM